MNNKNTKDSDLFEELHTKNNEARDKALLTLSSAALGFSVVFLDKVPPHACLYLVYFIWIFFTGAMLSVLYSFQTGAKLLNKLSEYEKNKEKYVEDIKFIVSIHNWHSLTIWLHRLAIIFFTIGVITFMVFSISNLQQKQDTMTKNTINFPTGDAACVTTAKLPGLIQNGYTPTASMLPAMPAPTQQQPVTTQPANTSNSDQAK